VIGPSGRNYNDNLPLLKKIPLIDFLNFGIKNETIKLLPLKKLLSTTTSNRETLSISIFSDKPVIKT